MLLNYDYENSVGYWIATANHAYARALQCALAPHGITFRQAQVLGWLGIDGPMSQRDLAEKMLIEPPNLVGVLDRMESAGFVERRACDQDRRKKLIHLCPEASTQWRKIADCGRVVRERAMEGLSPSERNKLKKLLLRVQENLQAPTPVG